MAAAVAAVGEIVVAAAAVVALWQCSLDETIGNKVACFRCKSQWAEKINKYLYVLMIP